MTTSLMYSNQSAGGYGDQSGYVDNSGQWDDTPKLLSTRQSLIFQHYFSCMFGLTLKYN